MKSAEFHSVRWQTPLAKGFVSFHDASTEDLRTLTAPLSGDNALVDGLVSVPRRHGIYSDLFT